MNLEEFNKASSERQTNSYTLRTRFVHKSGAVIHSRIHTEHIRAADPRNDFVVLVVDDITEDVEREECLEEMAEREAGLREHADAANKAKSEFLAAMSHEIRTPLTALMGMADLLEMTALKEDQKQFITTLKSAGRHLSTIINDVLDLSKMEADKLELKQAYFSVGDLVGPANNVYRAVATGKGLDYDLKADGDADNASVFGDIVRIRQILMNLLDNATKFTTDGGVTGTVTLTAQTGNDLGELKIVVRDTGIGIPEQVRQDIFAPFIQADLSRTKSFAGTGLGLAICRRLIDKMGGAIEVESEEGKGTTFSVTIPVSVQFGAGDKPQSSDNLSTSTTVKLADVRILVAEDDEVNRAMIKRMFSKWGCVAEFVVDGEEAVEAIRANTYDVIFLDIHMPRMSGMEVVESERNAGTPLPPVYAFTADVMTERVREYAEIGFDGCIEKPIDWDTIKEIIKGVAQADGADLTTH